MKGVIGTIISGLVVGLVVLVVTQMIADKPDLKYSLTAPISTTMLEGGESSYLQQLSIRNVGKEEAKKISINIQGVKISYELKKNSSSDVVKEFKKDSSLELIYDSLPPSGEIRVILKSYSTINNVSINISHSKGLATDVFSKNTLSEVLFPLLPFSISVLVLAALFYQLYGVTKESDAKYHGEHLLLKGQPMLITDKKWKELASTALESAASAYNLRTVEDIKATMWYRFLNNNTLIKVDSAEADLFRLKAEKLLVKSISDVANRTYKKENLLKLIYLERPRTMSDTAWDEVMGTLQGRYIDLLLSNLYLNFKSELPEGSLEKPEFLSDKNWNDLRDKIEMIVIANITSKICRNHNLELDSFDISGLKEENKNKLYQLSYGYKLKSVPVIDSAQTASDVLTALNKDEMNWLCESDAAKIRKMAESIKDILSIEKEVRDSMASYKVKKAETETLQTKVCSQLHIIDMVLNKDHDLLDRLEEYEVPFSKGNTENLRKVSALLKSSRRDRSSEGTFSSE